jgi:hypothetical protein
MSESDYFIYGLAAGPGPGGLPSLRKIPKHPADCFNKCEVALLPHGDDFTVAALSARTGNEFDLHFFRSEDWSWDTEAVVLAEKNARSLLSQHLTSTVITIGGERGTVGWVDLWHGILLCDLLAENRNLRYMPLPKAHDDQGCPRPYRDIAVVGGSLMVADLDVHGDRLPVNDPETKGPTSGSMIGQSPCIPRVRARPPVPGLIGSRTARSKLPKLRSRKTCGLCCGASGNCVNQTTARVRSGTCRIC